MQDCAANDARGRLHHAKCYVASSCLSLMMKKSAGVGHERLPDEFRHGSSIEQKVFEVENKRLRAEAAQEL